VVPGPEERIGGKLCSLFILMSTKLTFLQRSVGKISFTADIWSDENLRAFLAITLHWLARVIEDNSLELKSGLLCFHRITGNHTGKRLANIAMAMIDRAGIPEDKVDTHTIASCLTNESIDRSLDS
jgi:hypothetical protein